MSRDKQPWILGISASHNGSACLLRGDEIVVAIQEERLSRFKRQRIFGAGPSLAIDYCLKVHVDGTGRLQTVDRKSNPRFYDLIHCFYEKTGVPILLNTSFNVMGQPIIETPADALECLLNTGLDCCVFEEGIVFKESSNGRLKSAG
jgi:predicted NodU family carbamoyl transferase